MTVSSHHNCLSAGGRIKGEKLQSLHITSSSSHPPINHTALPFAVELLAFAQCPETPICHYNASKPFPTRWCLIIIQRPLTSTSSDPWNAVILSASQLHCLESMTRSGSFVREGGSCIWDSNLICFTSVARGSRVDTIWSRGGRKEAKLLHRDEYCDNKLHEPPPRMCV